ncbi:unnamed protein product [Pedinophyceae sp. YPF-701]|nr:unnamed protein product [Pedinophyceae sp. YPF-701]
MLSSVASSAPVAAQGAALRRGSRQRVSVKARAESAVQPGWPLKHCIEAQQFNNEMLQHIFDTADEMEEICRDPHDPRGKMLSGSVMATLFYEPSTRTRLSFEAAMSRLGGELISTENARDFSSGAKGETLADTIRTVEGYADVIVLRHFQTGASQEAASVSSVPIINAGDGPGQHPTQALLDVYTIKKELGTLDGCRLGLVGDLANGRTVRSLAYLMARCSKDVKMVFVAPKVVKMRDDIKDYLNEKGVAWEEAGDLAEVAARCDVLYQTRIQKERFVDRPQDYEDAKGKFIIDEKIMRVLPEKSIVMHPLPRVDEITVDVDKDPRAAYFRQAKNGMYIRMALLKILLKDKLLPM